MRNRYFCVPLGSVLFLLGIAALLLASSPEAANSSDPCDCNAVLVDGIFSFRAEKGDNEAYSEVLHFVATSTYEEMKKSFSAGGGASFAGFGLNANMSQDDFNKRIQELKKIDHSVIRQKSSKDLLERYGDKNVLAAWSKCKGDCAANGLRSYIEAQDDQNLVFHIRWKTDVTMPNPKVVTSYIRGAKAVGEQVASKKLMPKNTEVGPSDRSIPLFREQTDQPVIVHVSMEGADRNVDEYWPKVIPTPTPKPTPTPCPADVYSPDGKFIVRYFRPLSDGGYFMRAHAVQKNGANDGSAHVEVKITLDGNPIGRNEDHWGNGPFHLNAESKEQWLSRDTCHEIKAEQFPSAAEADRIDVEISDHPFTESVK